MSFFLHFKDKNPILLQHNWVQLISTYYLNDLVDSGIVLCFAISNEIIAKRIFYILYYFLSA